MTPKAAPVPLTYTQKMSKLYPLAPKLKASGDFSVVPGSAKAPGHGTKYRYRVDIEKGMGLDGVLFADAVQKTLNDKRSWAHNGAKTFERISSGHPNFVITLASPVTTADWCAKSGLDTLEENVSCDSAATDRVMINAYRWAQGSPTYGDSKIYPYRQMLINHEVGHRLGHNHVSCRTPAPSRRSCSSRPSRWTSTGSNAGPTPGSIPRAETAVSFRRPPTLTSVGGSFIFLGMPRCPEFSDHTAFELVLFGVTGHCVADILCS